MHIMYDGSILCIARIKFFFFFQINLKQFIYRNFNFKLQKLVLDHKEIDFFIDTNIIHKSNDVIIKCGLF